MSIQRFPRPYRFPRNLTEGTQRISFYKERAKKFGITWEDYKEGPDGHPGRNIIDKNGYHSFSPLRFPRSKNGKA